MKVIFQKEKILDSKYLEFFTKVNNKSGAIISFIGKVRPTNIKKKINSIDIELYEKMAMVQMKKILKKLNSQYNIQDYKIIHRYGRIYPGENIVLVLVASKHRKEGFRFIEDLVDWLKVKITFWKKENYVKSSEWVEQKEKDRNLIET